MAGSEQYDLTPSPRQIYDSPQTHPLSQGSSRTQRRRWAWFLLLLLLLGIIALFLKYCSDPKCPNLPCPSATSIVPTPTVPMAPSICPPPSPEAEVQTELTQVFFDYDEYVIKPSEEGKLCQVAERLKQNTNHMIRIEANCDPRGKDDYNVTLGEHRANAVKDYLVNKLKVEKSRIDVRNYGESGAKGVEEGLADVPPSWAYDRRVAFILLGR